ncbi:hypothetical protein FA15DRAFT_734246 [Coprinopsis marcescibilis]|nr:hypothetical protein FA15DRAFT_734246 [Coprinopsis marcescibilis]
MRYNFIFGFVLFLFFSAGNVLAHSRGAGNAEIAARGLLNVVDKMSVGAREFDDIEDYLTRRDLLEDLTTRELYEELNRRVILIPGGSKATQMRRTAGMLTQGAVAEASKLLVNMTRATNRRIVIRVAGGS